MFSPGPEIHLDISRVKPIPWSQDTGLSFCGLNLGHKPRSCFSSGLCGQSTGISLTQGAGNLTNY